MDIFVFILTKEEGKASRTPINKLHSRVQAPFFVSTKLGAVNRHMYACICTDEFGRLRYNMTSNTAESTIRKDYIRTTRISKGRLMEGESDC